MLEDVNQHLGRFPNTLNGPLGVMLPDQGEVGHCVEVIEIGASNPEEVTDHMIGRPGGQKLRERVEDVERPGALIGDHLVDLGGKGFEPLARIEFVGFEMRRRLKQRRVVTKAHVNNFFLRNQGLVNERADQVAVILYRIDLQHDIVADPEVIKNLI